MTSESIIILQDSAMLRQLRIEAVRTASVPTNQITTPGKIEVNPNRTSHVVLPVAGQIADVFVKIGDFVREGAPLIAINSPDAEAALSAHLQAESAVTQAKSAQIKTQMEFDRSKDLLAHEAIAQKEVVGAETALIQAKAALDQAVAMREQTKNRLAALGLKPGYFQQPVIVRAPISGKVLDTSIVPGEYRNDTNMPLMTLADLSTVWVSSEVPESYIRFIQIQEKVQISLVAYPGDVFRGRVSRIADTVNPQTRTVKVQAEIQNPSGRLKPEMFGSIHHEESPEELPVLPTGAVIQSGGHSVVFVEVGPGQFRQTEVQLGAPNNNVVPVNSGVRPGDKVVIDGAMLLKGFLRSLT